MLCFTYFRVMPEFLDFLVCFGYRSRPQDAYFSSFRQRTCLSASSQIFNVPELAWSGSEISMCYNLRSAERSGSSPNEWSIRLCAVHHTFDLINVRSNWIIIKNNGVLKERVEQASSAPSTSSTTSFDTLDRAFAAALNTHLVFCDLAVEQWRWYINNLDEQFQESSGRTLTAPVVLTPGLLAVKDEFSKHSRTDARLSNGSILGKISRTQTMLSGRFSIASPKPKVQSERIYTDPESGLSQPLPPHVATGSGPESAAQSKQRDAEHGEEQDFSFAKLQKIQYIEEKAHEALLVIRLNIGVIRQLKQYYDTILKSKHFPQNVVQNCQDDLEQFQLRINGILDDLQMQVIRAETLLQLLRDRKTLVISIVQSMQNAGLRRDQLHSILEHHNMEYNKLSTKKMVAMTDDMNDIARKTKIETVSMKVITVVTLFFLPGTFISVRSLSLSQYAFPLRGQSCPMDLVMTAAAILRIKFCMFDG